MQAGVGPSLVVGPDMSGSEDDRPGQARPGQARPGQARPGQARPGQARHVMHIMYVMRVIMYLTHACEHGSI